MGKVLQPSNRAGARITVAQVLEVWMGKDGLHEHCPTPWVYKMVNMKEVQGKGHPQRRPPTSARNSRGCTHLPLPHTGTAQNPMKASVSQGRFGCCLFPGSTA
eukprot:scaffold2636_cov340-Pavlova_lutheri.AAC.164